jgi:hypothetical protein
MYSSETLSEIFLFSGTRKSNTGSGQVRTVVMFQHWYLFLVKNNFNESDRWEGALS